MRPTSLALLFALLASPAGAQDLGAAKAFVTGLYAAYGKAPGPDYLGRQAKAVFSPALLELMRRDAARTPKGEVGTLDGDPICNCQDYEIRSVSVVVTAAGPTAATAIASFRNFGEAQSVGLDLVWVQGNWRVDDVHAREMLSLVKLLEGSLAAPGR
jgi:hypothetical protein